MPKFFKIIRKPYIGAILGPFGPNLGQDEFSWKKEFLSVFKYSNYLPSRKKKKTEKTNDPFL